jgi:phosphoribosyl-ATP pyrophosphohydrolase/phosphoribosyl-AMP cyclohydrolase
MTREKEEMMDAVTDAPKIDFAKMDGLVPGIVQDARTGEMLMLGFLNEVSYQKTLDTGFVTFWSRTRQKLQPAAGGDSGDGLRQRRAAFPGGGGRRRPGVP